MLSKSLCIRGINCPKSLWLKKYHPEVLQECNQQAMQVFQAGDEVGKLARSLIPNGREIIAEGESFQAKILQTQEWISQGEEVIYEATFAYEDVLVMVDILRIQDGKLYLYEVKSSSRIKDVYLDDIAIQCYVLRGLGYELDEAYIIHLDTSYVYQESLDISRLFKITNVMPTIKTRLDHIGELIKKFKLMLSFPQEPKIEIGEQCFAPYVCDGYEYCWKIQRQIPDYSVFDIAYLKMSEKFRLYHQGIVKIEEIKDLSSFSWRQKIQIECERTQKPQIDLCAIREFLNSLRYPIFHLDFETFQQAIPQWEGISPYEQIPFQYSLHIDYGDGRFEHLEFLAQEGKDPRYELAQNLCEMISNGVMVMAYNKSFEMQVIEKLARRFGDLSERLWGIYSNMVDLMKPFAQKAYYDPRMLGSHSIKKVLPALVPEMQEAYHQLDLIHHGGEAMEIFPKLHLMDCATKERYRLALLEYCKLDTLAMVKILEKLRQISD